jgi:hypothetical protein
MLKQSIVADTIANKLLVDLSEAEQEASNGGLSTPSLAVSIPALPPISIGMFDPLNTSCPACSSGLNPNNSEPVINNYQSSNYQSRDATG